MFVQAGELPERGGEPEEHEQSLHVVSFKRLALILDRIKTIVFSDT